ncbi:MAG: hypothetical protein DWQ10_03875 [Calditrichaeota bacterium]|nr:MAG: hypothetical protein DWQ10_03875 [Calditrichota bacterium]
MNKKEKIEQQVQKALDQFEHAEKLPPNPFFYTRIQARLQENQRQGYVISAILRPATLALLLVINISTAVWYLNAPEQAEQSDSHQELVELLAGDFNPDSENIELFSIK